jgi:hypothetical protein
LWPLRQILRHLGQILPPILPLRRLRVALFIDALNRPVQPEL